MMTHLILWEILHWESCTLTRTEMERKRQITGWVGGAERSSRESIKEQLLLIHPAVQTTVFQTVRQMKEVGKKKRHAQKGGSCSAERSQWCRSIYRLVILLKVHVWSWSQDLSTGHKRLSRSSTDAPGTSAFMPPTPLAHTLFNFHSFVLKMKQTGLSTLPIINTSEEKESDKMNEKDSLQTGKNELFIASQHLFFILVKPLIDWICFII